MNDKLVVEGIQSSIEINDINTHILEMINRLDKMNEAVREFSQDMILILEELEQLIEKCNGQANT